MIQVLRESQEAPREIQERIARAGGANRFGEPNFRVVWGWSRLTWIGGRWTDRDSSGNAVREVVELREVPKYFPFNRWHIERWLPPESYGSPEDWRAFTFEREDGCAIPALGPYPARGEYEHSFTIAAPDGGYLPLVPSVCDAVVAAVERSRATPPGERFTALCRREERLEREWDARADEIFATSMS